MLAVPRGGWEAASPFIIWKAGGGGKSVLLFRESTGADYINAQAKRFL